MSLKILITILLMVFTITNVLADAKMEWLKKNNWHKAKYWDYCYEKVEKLEPGYYFDAPFSTRLHRCLVKSKSFDLDEINDDNRFFKNEQKQKISSINTDSSLKNEIDNKSDKISYAKKKCLKLGFLEGTEKFADCSLKIIKINK